MTQVAARTKTPLLGLDDVNAVTQFKVFKKHAHIKFGQCRVSQKETCLMVKSIAPVACKNAKGWHRALRFNSWNNDKIEMLEE